MTASDIIAMIGAAAWAPQIFQWMREAMKKPKLELIPAPTVRLGYTPAGPFIQLAAAISSENRDVIVTDMIIRVEHESREEKVLKWVSVAETLASFDVPNERMSMSKTQNVLAIKVVTEILTEKYFTFNDPQSQHQGNEKTEIAREQFKYMGGQGSNAVDDILRSKEYKQAERALTDGVFWREGSYLLEIRMSGKELKSVQQEVLRMTLTRRDIELLQGNLQLISEVLKAYVTEGEQLQQSWIYVHAPIQVLES